IRFIQGTVRGSVDAPLKQHEQILDALAARDGDLAAALLKDHIAGSLAFLDRHLNERPEMFVVDDAAGTTRGHP
ncbi:MAG: FCD domain-containing protein, partial [Paracoccus sp. (in: a-proteobacteria)]|nr:FCD domain-containing protein [Paracoccus sp. (in: a-proteobacteria)]